MKNRAAEFASILRTRGLRAAVSTTREFLIRRYDGWIDARFDQRFNIDTHGTEAVADLTLVSDSARHATQYEPMSTRVARKLFNDLAPLAEGRVFVDYGSGKGKMLLLASRLNFKRVVGIEFAVELHAAAKENIARFRDPEQRCVDIESILCDAADYPLPDEPCVIFLFAPFRGEVLERVIQNIRASYRANPRPIHIAYAKPFHGDQFAAERFLARRRVARPRSFPAMPYTYEIFETPEATDP